MLPSQTDILFSGDVFVREDGRIDRDFETQHLGCFTGGMFLLGGQTFSINDHVRTGEKLARGCAWAYEAFATGLMPEITGFVACPSLEPCEWDERRWAEEGDQELAKGFRHARDPRYILRPEAIESIFYLYRITAQEELRDIAWKMFQSVVVATETWLAYSAIKDVRARGETEKEDSMEVCCYAYDLDFVNLCEAADTAHTELLDRGDAEVFLPDLFAAGPDQPRRMGSQYRSASFPPSQVDIFRRNLILIDCTGMTSFVYQSCPKALYRPSDDSVAHQSQPSPRNRSFPPDNPPARHLVDGSLCSAATEWKTAG